MTHPLCANQSVYLSNKPSYNNNNNVDTLQWLSVTGSTADSRIEYPLRPATRNRCELFMVLFHDGVFNTYTDTDYLLFIR